MTTQNWTVDAEAKTTSLEIFGGVLEIKRLESGKLHGHFERVIREAVAGQEATDTAPAVEAVEEGRVKVDIPLHHKDSVASAQVEAVALLTDTLEKNGYTFHQPAAEAEVEAADPF